MIPPVAPADLVSNPKFEKVHQHIAQNLLDTDASTKSVNASYQPASEQLHTQRISVAEDRILIASLLELCSSEDLPHDLQDLILIIATYISDANILALSDLEHKLISGDAQVFRSRLSEVVEPLAKFLNSQHDILASTASSANKGAYTSKIPNGDAKYRFHDSQAHHIGLSSQIDTLVSKVQRLRDQAAPSAQVEATNSLISLLKSQAHYLQHLIRHLEQRKHGAEARHLVARAQFLSSVAQGLEAKTKVTYLEERRDVYSPQLRQRLANRMSELEEEEGKIAVRGRKLQAALDEYEDAGGDALRVLGRRYGEIEHDIEEVKRDVETLSVPDARNPTKRR